MKTKPKKVLSLKENDERETLIIYSSIIGLIFFVLLVIYLDCIFSPSGSDCEQNSNSTRYDPADSFIHYDKTELSTNICNGGDWGNPRQNTIHYNPNLLSTRICEDLGFIKN